MSFAVEAILRAVAPDELRDSVERNPGAGRLRDAGHEPGWFELRLLRADGGEVEHVHSVVWRAPGQTWQEVADEEVELALEELCRSLRDFEGDEVWPDDIGRRDLRVDL